MSPAVKSSSDINISSNYWYVQKVAKCATQIASGGEGDSFEDLFDVVIIQRQHWKENNNIYYKNFVCL